MTCDLVLLRPEAWPALLAAPAGAVLVLAGRRRRRRRVRATGARGLRSGSARLDRRRALAFAGGLALLALALLEPAGPPGAVALEPAAPDVVLCLDVSRSMLARDVAPSRLGRAREEIAALADGLVGGRLGLVVFAGEARLEVPLTRDGAAIVERLPDLGPEALRRGGTDLGAALVAARGALLRAGARRRGETAPPRAIVVLTDGEDLAATGRAAAEACAADGLRVHGVALGSPRGARIPLPDPAGTGETFLLDAGGRPVVTAADEAGLAELAALTGGTCRRVENGAPVLAPLVASVVDAARGAGASPTASASARRPLASWPLLLGLALLVLERGVAAREGAR